MALFKTGSIVTDIKGKSGGTLFNNGKYGPYISNQSRKVGNAQVQNQQQRGRYRQVANLWSNLTAEQRQSWVGGARQETYTDKLGNVRHYQPRELFFERNLNLLSVSQNLITSYTRDYFPDYGFEIRNVNINVSIPRVQFLFRCNNPQSSDWRTVYLWIVDGYNIRFTILPVDGSVTSADYSVPPTPAYYLLASKTNFYVGQNVPYSVVEINFFSGKARLRSSGFMPVST